MTRYLKVLGLALVAAMAMSVVVASAASAAVFTASSYPATFTGSNTKGSEVFTTEAGNVECDSHFEGTENEASSTITVHVVYTNCEAFLGLSATVNMGTCHYLFHLTGVSNAKIDVVCGPVRIVITAGTCKVEIGGQTGLEKVGMAASGGKITASPNVSGITYNVTQDGFLCPFNGTGVRTTGTYTGSVTLSNTGGGTLGIE